MHLASTPQGYPLTEEPEIHALEFARVLEEDAEVVKSEVQIFRPLEFEEPELSKIKFADFGDLSLGTESDLLDEWGQMNFDIRWFPDGDLVALMTIEPEYPELALEEGLEGYVVLMFDVTETGKVEVPVVVDSSPPGVFDRRAIETVLKFRYQPRVVDQVPVRVQGVIHRVSFKLKHTINLDWESVQTQ